MCGKRFFYVCLMYGMAQFLAGPILLAQTVKGEVFHYDLQTPLAEVMISLATPSENLQTLSDQKGQFRLKPDKRDSLGSPTWNIEKEGYLWINEEAFLRQHKDRLPKQAQFLLAPSAQVQSQYKQLQQTWSQVMNRSFLAQIDSLSKSNRQLQMDSLIQERRKVQALLNFFSEEMALNRSTWEYASLTPIWDTLAGGSPEAAVPLLDSLAFGESLAPMGPFPQWLKARIHVALFEWTSAEQLYYALTEAYPDWVNLHLEYAFLLEKRGQHQLAAQYIRQQANTYPLSLRQQHLALEQLSLCAWQVGSLEEQSKLSLARANLPPSPMLQLRGQRFDAERAYALYLQAKNKFMAGAIPIPLLQEAQEIQEPLVDEDPRYQMDLAFTRHLLARCYTRLYQYDKARTLYYEALSLYLALATEELRLFNPFVAAVLNGIGEIQTRRHLFSHATETFNMAANTLNNDAFGEKARFQRELCETRLQQAHLSANYKDFKKAISEATDALRIAREFLAVMPEDAQRFQVRAWLQLVHYHLSLRDEALIRFYWEQIERSVLPKDLQVSYLMLKAKLLERKLDFKAAETEYLLLHKQLSQTSRGEEIYFLPEKCEVLRRLGEIYLKSHRLRKAESFLSGAIRLADSLEGIDSLAFTLPVFQAHLALGNYHKTLNQYSRALHHFEAAQMRIEYLSLKNAHYLSWEVEGLIAFADFFLAMNGAAEALQLMEKALKLQHSLAPEPGWYEKEILMNIQLNLGRAWLDLGNYADAERHLQQAQRWLEALYIHNPQDYRMAHVNYLRCWGRWNAELGYDIEAYLSTQKQLAFLNVLWAEDSATYDPYLADAYAVLTGVNTPYDAKSAEKYFSTARTIYTRLNYRYPQVYRRKLGHLYYLQGDAYLKDNKLGLAIGQFRRALVLQESYVEDQFSLIRREWVATLAGIIWAQIQRGRLVQATQQLEKAAALKEAEPRLMMLQSYLDLLEGRWEQSLARFQKLAGQRYRNQMIEQRMLEELELLERRGRSHADLSLARKYLQGRVEGI